MLDYIIKIFSKPIYTMTGTDILIIFGVVVCLLLASYGLYCTSNFVCVEIRKCLREKKARDKKTKGKQQLTHQHEDKGE